MDPKEYQGLAARTDVDRTAQVVEKLMDPDFLGGATLLHGVIGLTGEVGELASAVEKWLYYNKELDRVNVQEEIGDCLWYLAQMARAVGYDLGTAMEANIAKLRKRYPEKYEDRCAEEANRDREAERQIIADSQPKPRSIVIPAPGLQTTPLPEQTGQGWAEPPLPGQDSSEAPVPLMDLPPTHRNTQFTRDTMDQSRPTAYRSGSDPLLSPERRQELYGQPLPIHPRGADWEFQGGTYGGAEPPDLGTAVNSGMEAIPIGAGDGIRRRELSSSYNRYCIHCNRNGVHRTNRTGVCSHCWAGLDDDLRKKYVALADARDAAEKGAE